MTKSTFRGWLKAEGLSLSKAGKLLGCSKQYVMMLRDGDRTPSIAMVLRIEKVTGGKVTRDHWMKKAA